MPGMDYGINYSEIDGLKLNNVFTTTFMNVIIVI